MPGQHRRHNGGGRGYGWNGPGYGVGYGVAPDYAVLDTLPTKSGCGCSGSAAAGALGGIETWVKSNPLPALLGAFAIGWLVMGKKGRF
jgi:hypothetical protein